MMPKELRQDRRTRSVVGAAPEYCSCIRCSHVNHRDLRLFHKGTRVKSFVSAKSGQKWNKGRTLIFLLSREYISIFLEKNGPITVHFRSKKVGPLNCKRFLAGVAF